MKISRQRAYELGLECGFYGANQNNCHYSIFSDKRNTKKWERGKVFGAAIRETNKEVLKLKT